MVVVVVRPKVLPSDQRQSNYPGNWQQEATGRAAVTFTKMTNTNTHQHWRAGGLPAYEGNLKLHRPGWSWLGKVEDWRGKIFLYKCQIYRYLHLHRQPATRQLLASKMLVRLRVKDNRRLSQAAYSVVRPGHGPFRCYN